jgi:hypothetical protein
VKSELHKQQKQAEFSESKLKELKTQLNLVMIAKGQVVE